MSLTVNRSHKDLTPNGQAGSGERHMNIQEELQWLLALKRDYEAKDKALEDDYKDRRKALYTNYWNSRIKVV